MASKKTFFQLLALIFLPLFSEFMSLEATLFNSNTSNFNAGCIEVEMKALLKFKEGLKDPSGWLSSWVAGKDCCNWMGVSCSNRTGGVVKLDLRAPSEGGLVEGSEEAAPQNRSCLGGELNPSLLDLKYLNYLDLSQNDFQGMPIPTFMGSLGKLSYLNLSYASFAGMVPPHLGNLSNLHHLDLSELYSNQALWVSDLNWFSGLSSLEYLNLGGINLSKATTNWLQAVNMLSSLLELHLPFCQLHYFPQSLPFVNLTSLLVLDLHGNDFSSSIPQGLFNITTLVELNLSDCKLSGHLPDSLGHLKNLKSLQLFTNSFLGSIPTSIGRLSTLELLDLSNNMLNDPIPTSIGRLSSLKELDLSNNMVNGPIPTSIGRLSSLEVLDLSNNKMNGTIPESVGQLTELVALHLYGNSWEGIVSEIHFLGLAKLEYFDISSSNQSLAFNLRHDWVPFFSLYGIQIVNCKVGPTFPAWLRTQNKLSYVQIARAAISDTIPDWFWKLSRQIGWLDLSRNQLGGKLPSSLNFFNNSLVELSYNHLEGSLPLWPDLTELLMRNNLFSGPIPLNFGSVMSRLIVLDLSENLLNGSIPYSMSKLKNLYSLYLSNNHLSGKIPRHWKDFQDLEAIDLSKNNLSGGIPSSMCSHPRLNFLRLSSNDLSGELSPSLRYCSRLGILDLGDNRFSGSIPKWIGESLLSLSVLSLQDNMFTGNIPRQLCWLSSLHILDLAHNSLSGSIPPCLGNLRGLSSLAPRFPVPPSLHITYPEEMELVIKGRKDEYTVILPLVNSIDLSRNNLWGEIPEKITNLLSLGALNLSQNQLTGKIPEKIGDLQLLETLDLSCNNLSGPIPPSMSFITFLNHLNLSHNNLSGQIPTTNQFQTFNDPSIYEGNPELCGPPVSTMCSAPNKKDKDDKDEDEDGSEMLWFYLSVALGFIVGFWAVCGSLVIKKSWRLAYFQFLDEMKDKLFMVIVVNVARFQRKMEMDRNRGRGYRELTAVNVENVARLQRQWFLKERSWVKKGR